MCVPALGLSMGGEGTCVVPIFYFLWNTSMPELIPVLTQDDIAHRVADTASRISLDYPNDDLIVIGVLKGSFIFLADLVRCLTIGVKVDFIGAASYGSGTTSSGNIRLTKDLDIDIRNKDVLVVEDIVDTGLTLSYCIDHLRLLEPRTLRICAMVDKTERREESVIVDYACYQSDTGFLVGYGLDYDQQYRELPGIYTLKL
jgi:hypoxanthine phosphoribosyltransferase